MVWRRLLKMLVGGIAFCYSLEIVEFLLRMNKKFIGLHDFFAMTTTILVVSVGIVGLDELSRGGHRKVRRVLKIGLICSFAFPFILILALVAKNSVSGVAPLPESVVITLLENSYVPFAVLSLATLPLALYLNRSKKQNGSQTDTANAS
jgi:hypothetical protein